MKARILALLFAAVAAGGTAPGATTDEGLPAPPSSSPRATVLTRPPHWFDLVREHEAVCP